eukprot:jgi/Tetstr1/441206/TSEL_029462.t1
MTAELVCNLYRRGSDNSAVAPSPWQIATPEQEIWDAVVKALGPRFKWDRNSHSGAHRLVCKAWSEACRPAELTALALQPEKLRQADRSPRNWAQRGSPASPAWTLPNCFLDISEGVWGGSDELLPPPLQQLPRLTALDLAQCDALTDRVLAAI